MPGARDTHRPIAYVDLTAQVAEEGAALLETAAAALRAGAYVGGAEIDAFEREMAAYLGVRHVIGLNSGTDALILGMEALGIGPGDEVITPPNSFIASTSAIVRVGATPVFADVLPDQCMDPDAVERVITPRTKAIMPVHLTGRVADMTRFQDIARHHGLMLIEDAAQAVGSRLYDRMAGSFGDIGCFSAHPLKNLNACGDAGFVATDRDDVNEKLRLLRNIGMVDRDTVTVWAGVSRLDVVQAAILRMRLKRLPDVIARRRANAALYQRHLNQAAVFVPPCQPHEFNTFHTFVIQVDRRDELRAALAGQGIATNVHYPVPIHLQPVARSLDHGPGSFPATERQSKRILTLPINQFLAESDIIRVAEAVNDFFR